MKHRWITTALIVLATTAGLPVATAQDGRHGDAVSQQRQALTPLAIGNTWVYENNADGVMVTEQIAGVVLFDGRPWYLVRSAERPIDEPDGQASFVWESWLAQVDGVDTIAFAEMDEKTGTLRLTEPSGEYRYPVAKGDTYRPIENDVSTTIEVVGVDVPVTTKAGTFKCIAYREHNADEEDVTITTYLAPGVGVVRIRTDAAGKTTDVDLVRVVLVDDAEQNAAE